MTILLTNQSDLETFTKLLEIISVTFDNYTTNKSFGKLLLHIVNSLGQKSHVMEPLLSRIIASHKSIWKSKIQKCLESNQLDTQLFSQSFRI